ncbi:class 1 fructose-bisphosphatase [Salsipaludibacter albus]|uniref:class 1 fructose-bisphosphatase n=1 Tax=Salsipaludibacter albus TaxID=2849650 RepID=UPI001EE4BAEF|nr:class 1 fructose-bisphosphatase [Salsipaludibacter albus]MBY5162764.1 class 1 fructose-bisphosphatase [Salsipaludibacter albus]
MDELDRDPPAPPVGADAVAELVTIEQFLQDRRPEGASGDLTALLYDLALAGKLISNRTRRAGLTELMGASGVINPQGEEQKALDLYADDVVTSLLRRGGRVCAIVSEERPEPTIVDGTGTYVVVHDPLDGSSNIDSNVSIGTIFGIYPRLSDPDGPPDDGDWLRPGRDLVAAGYVLYGTSTVLVLSTGDGVHAFTLDPEVGEFVLTWADMHHPDTPAYYSFNHASSPLWDQGIGDFVAWLERPDTPQLSQRYIGSAVADFHRNLLHGGIYGYPAETGLPDGKLRMVYEGAPLAFLAEQAGGLGSDGHQPLLDVVPTTIHQRTPVFLGHRGLVERLQDMVDAAPGP